MVTGPLVFELTLKSTKVGCSPWEKRPTLAWKKADIFKINGDDDETHYNKAERVITSNLLYLS